MTLQVNTTNNMAPIVGSFAELPDELLPLILQWVYAPKDVANLNLVSKQFKVVNQSSDIAFPRIRGFLTNGLNDFLILNFGIKLRPEIMQSYEHYTTQYIRTLDYLPRRFYEVLPIDMKNEIKRQTWIANGRNDEGYWLGFGDRVVNTAFFHTSIHRYHILFRTAITNFLSNLGINFDQ